MSFHPTPQENWWGDYPRFPLGMPGVGGGAINLFQEVDGISICSCLFRRHGARSVEFAPSRSNQGRFVFYNDLKVRNLMHHHDDLLVDLHCSTAWFRVYSFWDYSGTRLHGREARCVLLLGDIPIPEWTEYFFFSVISRTCVLLFAFMHPAEVSGMNVIHSLERLPSKTTQAPLMNLQ